MLKIRQLGRREIATALHHSALEINSESGEAVSHCGRNHRSAVSNQKGAREGSSADIHVAREQERIGACQ